MKKIYITSILLFLFILESYTQNTIPIHDRDPKFPKIETPNAASFSKFIDNPISLYNGTPDVSITLFDLKDGAINLPISLRYNTSGIKVNEEASWVGLGWNLNVGGVITKNTVGKADEVDNGSEYRNFLQYLSGRNTVDTYQTFAYTEAMHNAMFTKLSNLSYNWMGQLNPDVYYFSYPGGGGKFIIDHRENKIYLLDRTDATRIICVENTVGDVRYNGFEITTPEGIVHYFNRRTSISDPAQPLATTSINYTLDYTVYPNGQRVDYTYTTKPYKSYSINSESYQRVTENNLFLNNLDNIVGNTNYSEGTISSLTGTEFILTGIQTTNYLITFTTSARTDLQDGVKLDKITIEPRVKNTDSTIKQMAFQYDYFIGKSVGTSYLTASQYSLNRLRLNSINYLDKTNVKTDNRYDFYYEDETLPQKGSYATDYWGYYNGQANNSLIPNLLYLYYGLQTQDNYKSIVDHVKKINVYGPSVYKANRASEEKFTKAGILKGIKYPTGGYREFEYELNTFVDYFIPTVTQINNDLYYKDNISDRNNSADKKSCSFTLEETTDISLDYTMARGLNTWYDVMKNSLKIYQVNGGSKVLVITTDCSSECFSNYTNSVSSGIINKTYTTSLNAGQYMVEIDFPDALGDQTLSSSNHGEFRANLTFPKPIRTKESKGCGLRIKNITSYNNIDKKEKLLSTNYIYEKEGTTTSSGVLHDKPKFTQQEKCFYSIKYQTGEPINGTVQQWFALIEQAVIGSSNYISNPYGSVVPIAYSRVKETQTGAGSQGYTIYNFINTEPTSTQNSVRLDNPLNGKLNETKSYDSNNQLIKQEKYTYRSSIYHQYYGINIIYRVNMYPGLFSKGMFSILSMGEPSYISSLFYIIAHALNSVDTYLDKKESTIDGITTTETYTYNSETHQLKQQTTTLSDNNTLNRTYTYINDYNITDRPMVYDQMLAKNMLSYVVEEGVYRGNGYFGGSLTLFGTNSLPETRYFSELKGTTSSPPIYKNGVVDSSLYPLSNVSYKKYDSYSNPIYLVHNGASDLIYLWSYKGQYPIAEIKNATYDQTLAAVKAVFGIADINALSQLDNPDVDKIELLRANNNLANALVTTFSYTPLLGIRTATDSKGITTFYDYDDFGRLKEVYFKENGVKRIIDSYEYNLSNK